MATTAKKAKQKTREELQKELAGLQASNIFQQERAAEFLRKNEKLESTVTDLRGIIAELEREKAMLQGYIERVIQDEKNVSGIGTDLDEDRIVDAKMERMRPRRSPFVMPMLSNQSAGINETSNTSYDSSNKLKPWYKL